MIDLLVVGGGPAGLTGQVGEISQDATSVRAGNWRARWISGRPHEPDRAAGPLRQRVSSRTAGRAMLVGDAAGYIDALTGEGLGLAFGAAELLVNSVVADQPGAYDRRWRQMTRRYRVLTTALLQASSHAAVRSGVVPAGQAMPNVFGKAVNLLC